MLRLSAIFVGLTLVGVALAPRLASASDSVLEGTKLVVDVEGAPNLGTESLAAEVRRALANAVGPLVPSRRFDDAKAELKLKGPKAASTKALAAAGQRVSAEFVVRIKVQKARQKIDVRLRLIDVASGAVELDQRVKNKGPDEARSLGASLAQQAIERLDQLVRAKRTLAEIEHPREPPARAEAHAEPPPPPPPPPVIAEPPTSDPARAASEANAPGSTETAQTQAKPEVLSADEERARFVAAKEAARRARANPPPAEGPTVSPTPPPATETSVETNGRPPNLLRFTVAGGSGLMRSYQLSASEIGRSALSHVIDPIGLLALEGEVVLPKIGAGLELRGAFRPVRYSIDAKGPASSAPSGSILDTSGALTYHLLLGGGDDPLRLIPRLGFRGTFAQVEEHPEAIIPSSTTLAVYTGAAMRWPINDVFEVSAGLEGGLVVAYQETPSRSGTSVSGLMLAGKLGARIWVTQHLAIAFDNDLTMDSLSFGGAPTRTLPPDEVGRVADATVRILDLRSSVGATLRF